MADKSCVATLPLRVTYIFELHAEYIYPLRSLKCSTHVILQHFLVKRFFLYNTEKPLQTFKSAAKARKELSGVSNIFTLKRNVKPHKVLLTSQVQLFSGCGFFFFFLQCGLSLFLRKGISKIMKSPGPLKTWMALSLLWTSWKNCEFMMVTWCFTLDWVTLWNKIRPASKSEVWNWLDFCCFPRFLQGNQIRSVTKKSFSGLDALQHLWVGLVFHWLFPKVRVVN